MAAAFLALSRAAVVLCAALELVDVTLPVAFASDRAARPRAEISVSLSPAKVVASARSDRYRFAVTIADRGSRALAVDLAAASLGQATDGVPTFGPEPRVGGALTIALHHFVLRPGEVRSVPVVVILASGAAAFYGAVLATIAPLIVGRADVAIHERLVSLVEIRGAAPPVVRATITGITATIRHGRGPLVIGSLVHDIGDVVIRPVGDVTIDVRHRLVASVPLGAARILPGEAVVYSGAWDPPGPLAGTVTVRVHLVDPVADAVARVEFRAGAALAPAARITRARVDASPGGAVLSATVANTGNMTYPAVVATAVFDGLHYRPVATTALGVLAPGHVGTARQVLRLAPGTYELAVNVLDGVQTLDERQLTVTVAGTATSRRAALAVALLVLAAAGLTVLRVLVRRRRRRRRRKHAKPQHARHPSGPVGPARGAGRPRD